MVKKPVESNYRFIFALRENGVKETVLESFRTRISPNCLYKSKIMQVSTAEYLYHLGVKDTGDVRKNLNFFCY